MNLQSVRLCITMVVGVLMLGCGSVSKISVASNPSGAEVSLVDDSGLARKIGETPMDISDEHLEKTKQGLLRIQFNKVGFVHEQVFVDTLSFKKTGKIQMALTPLANWSGAYVDKNAADYLNDVVGLAAQIQGATVRGDFVKAQQVAQLLVDKYPKVASGWSLLGNIYYLQNNASKALESYQKSLSLDSSNQQVKDLIQKLGGGFAARGGK